MLNQTMAPHHTLRFADLPSHILERIFLNLNQTERLCIAPLICRHTKAACDASCELFSSITAAFVRQSFPGKMGHFIKWLTSKQGRVHKLTLTLQDSPGLVVAAHVAVHAAGDSLEQLYFTVEGEASNGVTMDCLVGPLGKMTKMVVNAHHIILGQAMQSASSLRKLALHADVYDGMWLCNGSHAVTGREQGPSTLRNSSPASHLPPGLIKFSFGGQQLGDARSAGLPYGLHAASSLQGLAVHGRQLGREDAEALAQLTALKELHMERCLSDVFPHQLSNLTGLQVLYIIESYLGDDSTENWEEALRPLQQLVFLSLSGCYLPFLPRALHNAPGLQALHLEGTGIERLPAGPYLARLQELALDWADLFSSHATLAQHSTQLTSLYVAGSDYRGCPYPCPIPLTAAAREQLVGDLLDSLSAMRALRQFIHVRPDPAMLVNDPVEVEGKRLQACVELCLLRLGRRCPHLELDVIQGDKYGWSIEDLGGVPQ